MKLLCVGCGVPVGIKPGDGVVHLSYREAEQYRSARQAWEEQHPADGSWTPRNLTSLPSKATWGVHCDNCNPHWNEDRDEACGGCYWVDAVRMNTPARLLHWTSHLMEKRWLRDTDWGRFIGRFGEDA